MIRKSVFSLVSAKTAQQQFWSDRCAPREFTGASRAAFNLCSEGAAYHCALGVGHAVVRVGDRAGLLAAAHSLGATHTVRWRRRRSNPASADQFAGRLGFAREQLAAAARLLAVAGIDTAAAAFYQPAEADFAAAAAARKIAAHLNRLGHPLVANCLTRLLGVATVRLGAEPVKLVSKHREIRH
jgi:hypothetical protein